MVRCTRSHAERLSRSASRRAYRCPDGKGGFDSEHMLRTLTEGAIWLNVFDSFDQALGAIPAW